MISIVIPTYNRKEYLRELLDTIHAQTIKDYEILVVDDNSTDGTKEFIEGISSDNLRYLNFGKIGNIGKLRNIGIAKSRFDLIAFCDDDDLWYPEKLEIQLDQIKKYNLVCSNAQLFSEVDPSLDEQLIKNEKTRVFGLNDLLIGNIIITSTVMLNKKLFKNISFFNETTKYYCSEDYDLWLRIAEQQDIYFCNDSLAKYRLQVNNSRKFENREKMLSNVVSILERYSQGYSVETSKATKLGQLNIELTLLKLYLKNFAPLKFIRTFLNLVKGYFKYRLS